jgi:hypothetical protein
MPPRRGDRADEPDAGPPDSYASIWFELSEAQRSAILAAIGSTAPPEQATSEAAQTPAVLETMQALRRELLDEDIVVREPMGDARPVDARAPEPSGASWGWRPRDNGLLTATFDPALIVGGSAPDRGDLVCQRVTVPAGAAVRSVLLEVVTPGADLTVGAANVAAVYEADGTRAGWTEDQAARWAAPGLQRSPLVQHVPPQAEARSVWVAFIADGATMPGFAVPWISRAARPNLGLPSPGPQRAGRIPGQSTCPEAIAPIEMQPTVQYWIGLT